MASLTGTGIPPTSSRVAITTNVFSATTTDNASPNRKRLYSVPLVRHETVERLRQSLNLSRYVDSTLLPAEDNNGSCVEDRAKRGGRLGALLRRASSTVKARTKTRRNTHSLATLTSDVPECRPSTSSTWNKLRQAASFRSWRPEELEGGGNNMTDSCNELVAPIPGLGNAPPVIPHLGGAAARATAAAQNELLLDRVRNLLVFDETPGDHDSGVNILATIPNHQPQSQIPDGSISSRVDFIHLLPLELSIQILSHLNCHGLAQAARVSHTWHRISCNHHVWREAFLADKSRTFATSAPVEPGSGLGLPEIQPHTAWKEVYRVRQELDMKWKRGETTPVYLHGHLDSIYCIQFDE
jgi:F-box and WD-40 domain protein 1/11